MLLGRDFQDVTKIPNQLIKREIIQGGPGLISWKAFRKSLKHCLRQILQTTTRSISCSFLLESFFLTTTCPLGVSAHDCEVPVCLCLPFLTAHSTDFGLI